MSNLKREGLKNKDHMDRKIKIMVGSTVYGFENELYQIVALLQSMGYEVLNSHVGTIKVNPN